jgi:DNA-binding MarR family transcriptional regulator
VTAPTISYANRLELLPERLGAATSRLQAVLRRQFAQEEISLTQGRTLSTLATRGPHRVTDLALIEQVAQPTMSTLVARLEAHGLVDRSSDPSDSKTTLISITREGKKQLRSMVALRTNLLASGLALLAPSDRRSLEAALPALERLVDELQGTPHAQR